MKNDSMTSPVGAFRDAANVDHPGHLIGMGERYLSGNLNHLVMRLAECVEKADTEGHTQKGHLKVVLNQKNVFLTRRKRGIIGSIVTGMTVSSAETQKPIIQFKISAGPKDIRLLVAADGKRSKLFAKLPHNHTDFPQRPPEEAFLPREKVIEAFRLAGEAVRPYVSKPEPVKTKNGAALKPPGNDSLK